jgi:RNA polymerase sigma factor (sigma-70 family)
MAATETSTRANAALDELYRQHVGEVYRYTYAVLGNHADAEDVTQTTFVNALRALERGETPEEPSRWLVVIAHNLVRQRWRQAASRPALVELEADVPDGVEEEDGYELEELVRALQRIPETQREAIVMRELEGRSYREIATMLGLSTSALETLLFRARRSLADELENVVTCENAELSLSKQLDGRLSRKERRRLDEHLADCPDCARLAATQHRQRRAFKGLALLPLPIGLALFKGAPSAAAATSLPTIGLGTAGAGAHGTGVAGAAGAGASTSAGGAAVGSSVAGGLAVKVAAIIVTATVATGVGYKGVEAVRDRPSKPAPVDVKTKPHEAPTRVVSTAGAQATHARKAQGNGKAHARAHGKAQGHKTHAVSTPPGQAKAQSTPATGTGNGKAHTAGSAHAKQADATKPKSSATPKETAPAKPKNDGGKSASTPVAPPAEPVTTPPAADDPATPPAPSGDDTATPGDTGSAGGSGTTGTSTPVTQPPSTPPSTSGSPTPTPVQTPPSESTGGATGSSGNGEDNGKKLGHYNENQDGKHL